ncbi:MAG: class I SAM-dependent methyltransferase [Chloroflexi bacterium]|nr:class I SAM-dependent methyltransferase [Chloroflexota bacterium]MCC6892998.1 methyltransferase domain-containing protein [Anaerolineae bacterium]
MTDDTRTGYDRVAGEYASRFIDELSYKPYDRHLLNFFAGQVKERGVVCDIGTGPGQIVRYLHQQGADAMGIDLSDNRGGTGAEVTHLDSFFDKPVSIDFTFLHTAEVRGYLEAAGFSHTLTTERAPYEQEHASQRGYILAQNII